MIFDLYLQPSAIGLLIWFTSLSSLGIIGVSLFKHTKKSLNIFLSSLTALVVCWFVFPSLIEGADSLAIDLIIISALPLSIITLGLPHHKFVLSDEVKQ